MLLAQLVRFARMENSSIRGATERTKLLAATATSIVLSVKGLVQHARSAKLAMSLKQASASRLPPVGALTDTTPTPVVCANSATQAVRLTLMEKRALVRSRVNVLVACNKELL